jgi:hypothetical protein
MDYDLPPQREEPKNQEDFDSASDVDRVRDYSRQFEGDFLQGEGFPDKEDPADFWKKA